MENAPPKYFETVSMRKTMKKRLLCLLPIALFAAIWGINWRQQHPAPTAQDEQVRQLLATADYANLEVTTLIPWSDADTGGPNWSVETKIKATLEPSEFAFVSNAINLSEPVRNVFGHSPYDGRQSFDIVFYRGKERLAYIRNPIRIQPEQGVQAAYSPNNGVFYRLHPTTVYRCRQMLSQHPEIIEDGNWER